MRPETNIRTFLAAASAALILQGCIADHFPDTPDQPRGSGTLGITIGFEGSPRSVGGNKPDYELGIGLENYLDIDDDNYRIYFFTADAENDEDNTYIATFNPFSKPTIKDVETLNGVQTYYYYQFLGQVPVGMPMNFKIVTIANWSSYPQEAESATSGAYQLVKGVTKLQDICRHASAQFARLSPAADGSWLNISDDSLIPFYGVREYNLRDYVAEADIITNDEGTEQIKGDTYVNVSNLNGTDTSLPLLRAMAKVEVILDNTLIDFEEVAVNRVNEKGFNAPENALQHSDYDHGYTWDLDFIRGVHLPDGTNKPGPDAVRLSRMKDSDGNLTNRWMGYIPEYRNIGEGDNYSYITVKMAKPDNISDEDWENIVNPKDPETGAPTGNTLDLYRKIYFATDGSEAGNKVDAQAVRGEDGKFTPGRFNIERNNIYRFTLSGMNANLNVQVDIQPYAECKLDYDLGLMRDEAGDLKVIPDNDGKLPPYFEEFMKSHSYPYEIVDGQKVLLTPQWEIGDYYAIHKIINGNEQKISVVLKDIDECHVLTNFSARIEGGTVTDDIGCSARTVLNTSLGKEYRKDKDGHQRLQHNHDHSTIVLNHQQVMLFKTESDDPADKKRYLVESWDEKSGEFWYLVSEEEIPSEDDPTKIQIKSIFYKGDKEGESENPESKVIVEDKLPDDTDQTE